MGDERGRGVGQRRRARARCSTCSASAWCATGSTTCGSCTATGRGLRTSSPTRASWSGGGSTSCSTPTSRWGCGSSSRASALSRRTSPTRTPRRRPARRRGGSTGPTATCPPRTVRRSSRSAGTSRSGYLAEQRLAASEAQCRTLAERSSDLVWQFVVTPEPHLAYLSPSVEDPDRLDGGRTSATTWASCWRCWTRAASRSSAGRSPGTPHLRASTSRSGTGTGTRSRSRSRSRSCPTAGRGSAAT